MIIRKDLCIKFCALLFTDMLEYIKTVIIAFISSVFAPVAASSSAHFVLFENILSFSKTKEESAFYYSIISVIFSLVSMFFVRKIYKKGFIVVFGKKKKTDNMKTYKTMMKGILVSLVPCVLMLIPVSSEKIVLDYFTDYLWKNNILVSAFCCFAMGFVLLIAAWFTKQKSIDKHRNSTLTDVARITVYQTISYIFPGLSPVSLSATGLIVGGVEESVIIRDVLIYTSPSLFLISIMRLVKTSLTLIEFDIIKIAICVLSAVAGTVLMLNIVSKVNIKKSFLFFSVYSVLFGLFMIIASLFIL